MATDLFDPSKIDAAVGEAFSTKPTRPAAPAAAPTTPAPLRTNNPGALMPRGQLAQFGTMDEGLRALDQNLQAYGKRGINTLEGVINTWSPPTGKGNTPEGTRNYINHVARVTGLKPDQAIDLNDPLVRLQLTAGITQFESGPNAIYGQRQAPATPSTTAAPRQAPAATPGALTVEDLMKPEAVNAAVAEAMNEPPKKGAVASKVTQFLKSATDLGVSAFNQYQQGKRVLGEIVATPIAGAAGVVLGPIAGIIESVQSGKFGTQAGVKAGEQKAAAVQQALMPELKTPQSQAVFGAIQKGMEASKLPPIIPELMGIAPTVAPATRQAIAPLREAAAELKIAPPKPTTLGAPGQPIAPGMPAPPAAPQPVMGRGSVGAAGVPDATIIRQALTGATPEFQQLYGNMPLDKVNTPTVLRHLEADSLDIPVRLTKGQGSADVAQLSKEQNLRGSQPELAYRFNEQNQLLIDNLQRRKELAAPDVYATKTIESSQALIDAYKALDDTRNIEISAAYKKLEDAAGGQFPVDGAALAKNAEAALAKKLKTDFLPTPIKNQLERFKNGEPMTFEQFEAMRTNLAAETRKAERSGDGNAAMASSIVREVLEQLPLKGEAAGLKPLADQARALAKARFDALKKDPAYKAAVNDAVPADKYFEKFVVNGVNKNINTMVDTLGRDSVAHQHMRAGTINYLSDKAGIVDGRGNFSQANYNKAIKGLDDVNNFAAIFDPESQMKLRTLGNVAAYTQFQPRGAFVNNSGSVVAYLANKAEQTGNLIGLGKFGIPAGTIVRQKYQAGKEKRFAKESLEPGAGSTLQDLSRQGQPKQSNQPMSERREPTLD